jgi:hypothetical protein
MELDTTVEFNPIRQDIKNGKLRFVSSKVFLFVVLLFGIFFSV